MTPFAEQLLAWLFGERSDRDDELPDTEQLIVDFTCLRKNGATGIPEDVRAAVTEALAWLERDGSVARVGERWRFVLERDRGFKLRAG